MSKQAENHVSTAVTRESPPNVKPHTLDRAVLHIIEQNEERARQLAGHSVFGKPTE